MFPTMNMFMGTLMRREIDCTFCKSGISWRFVVHFVMHFAMYVDVDSIQNICIIKKVNLCTSCCIFCFVVPKHCLTSCVVTKQPSRQTNAVGGTLQETLQGSRVGSSVIDLATLNLPGVAENQYYRPVILDPCSENTGIPYIFETL